MKMFIKMMSNYKVTAITGVNTLFNVLLHHHDFPKIDFSALKLTLSGGMALQKVLLIVGVNRPKALFLKPMGSQKQALLFVLIRSI